MNKMMKYSVMKHCFRLQCQKWALVMPVVLLALELGIHKGELLIANLNL